MPITTRPSVSLRTDSDAIAFLSRLELGDIILYEKTGISFASPIVRYQRIFPENSASACTFVHAAIFVGNGAVIDAQSALSMSTGTSGVRLVTFQISQACTVCALRLFSASTTERAQLVSEAHGQIGVPYDSIAVGALAWAYVKNRFSIFGKPLGLSLPWPPTRHQRYVNDQPEYKRLICSRLVDVVYLKVFGINNTPIAMGLSPVITPADIYMSEALDTVT